MKLMKKNNQNTIKLAVVNAQFDDYTIITNKLQI